MVSSYVPILVMIIASAVLAGGMVTGSMFLGPRKPNTYKSTAYECGMTPVGSARERFPIKFYLIAMLFIIFDIETIFLYPWAVTYKNLAIAGGASSLKVFSFVEMIIFVVILFVGYFYIIGKGALDWDESDQARSVDVRAPEVLARRAAIRYGNEDSGPVDMSRVPSGIRTPTYGASSQEETIAAKGRDASREPAGTRRS